MMRELSYSSLRMGLYEPARHLIVGDDTKSGQEIKLWQKIAAGLISGAIGSSIANPTDLVKIRFQSWMPGQPRPYKHTMHAFWQIWRESGFSGLYRGVVATATRAAVLTSAQLSSYDETKWLMRSWGFQDGYAVHLTAAIVAGLVTTTATSPVDVIKTRVMNDKEGVYKGSLDCFLKTLKSEGVRGMCTSSGPSFFLAYYSNYRDFLRKFSPRVGSKLSSIGASFHRLAPSIRVFPPHTWIGISQVISTPLFWQLACVLPRRSYPSHPSVYPVALDLLGLFLVQILSFDWNFQIIHVFVSQEGLNYGPQLNTTKHVSIFFELRLVIGSPKKARSVSSDDNSSAHCVIHRDHLGAHAAPRRRSVATFGHSTPPEGHKIKYKQFFVKVD
jgi:hypothetical protein